MIKEKNRLTLLVTVLMFVCFTAWWGVLQIIGFLSPSQDLSWSKNIFGSFYGLLALWGGLLGLIISKKWGGFKSSVGTILIFFSIGLLLQEFGQIVYSYYNIFAQMEIPYPSVGDVGYFGSVLMYIVGAFLLVKLLILPYKKEDISKKYPVLLLPVALLAISYYMFLNGHSFDPNLSLRNFLDLGYPVFQAVYVSLGLIAFTLCSRSSIGLMKRKMLFLIVALVSQYASDFTFLYMASRGLPYVGGIVDYLYLVSYFLMTLAIIELNSVFERSKNGTVTNGGTVT